MTLNEQKAATRERLRATLRAMIPEARTAGSREICARLRAQPIWSAAASVLLFVPTREEPDVWTLVTEALAGGKSVLLPRYSAGTDDYVGAVIRECPGDLQPGEFGILEPNPACPIFNLKQLDLALVPGIGFALNGARLGRGKGYYDRLLSGVPGWKCGVAFDGQVTDEIPVEPHDVRLNCILTPTRWHVV